jgi:hypothetical protein
MNLTIKLLIALLVLSTTACNAQKIKNQKTETVHIYGNCGMCKNTIENAGNKKKEAKVEWNKETKMASIAYDSLKTTSGEILKRIALSGYDNQLFMSPEDTYNNLPNCCQYERAKKEVSTTEPMLEMTENHNQHSHSDKMEMTEIKSEPKAEITKTNDLKLVFDDYFALKNALIKSDGNLASNKANDLMKSLESVRMNNLEMDVHMVWMKVMKALKTDAQNIANSQDEKVQRTHFISLSDNMYQLLKVAKYDVPVYYQHCPMANDGKGANWLSTKSAVKNPYYGSMMLNCGKVVETID